MMISKLKILIFCLVQLLFFLRSFGQTPISFLYNNRVNIDSLTYDSGIRNLYWNNGMLSMGFSASASGTDYGLTLSHYDTLGNIDWKKIIYLPAYTYFGTSKILALNNSGFYISGTVYKDSISEYDVFIAKYDQNGDSIFFKILTDTLNNVSKDMDDEGDTLILLNEWKENTSDLNSRISIYKVDTNGVLHSSYLGPLDLKFPDKVIFQSNYIYVGGTRRTTASSSYQVKVFIQRYHISFLGLTSWNPSLTLNEYFQGFTFWNNRLFVSSWVTGTWGAPYFKGRIGRLFPSGGGYDEHIDIWPETANGGIFDPVPVNSKILAVPGCYGNGFTDNYLFFIDSSINNLCSTPVGLSDTVGQALGYITVLPGNRIASSGLVYSPFSLYPRQDHWNFVTQNVMQYLYNECGLAIDEDKTELLQIYPNPSSGTFTLFSPSSPLEELIISDIKGYIFYKDKGMNQNLVTVTKNFQTGIYLLRVVLDNGNVNVCKLVVTR